MTSETSNGNVNQYSTDSKVLSSQNPLVASGSFSQLLPYFTDPQMSNSMKFTNSATNLPLMMSGVDPGSLPIPTTTTLGQTQSGIVNVSVPTNNSNSNINGSPPALLLSFANSQHNLGNSSHGQSGNSVPSNSNSQVSNTPVSSSGNTGILTSTTSASAATNNIHMNVTDASNSSSLNSNASLATPSSPNSNDKQIISMKREGERENFVDITEYLNLPQTEAAKRLGIPTSTLSKRWKEAVVNRKWPYRTVAKLDKEIMTLLHNIPQGPDAPPLPPEIETNLGGLLRKRQEELRPVVIRL